MKTTGFTLVLRIVLVHFVDGAALLEFLWKTRPRNEMGRDGEADSLLDGSELSALSSRDSYNLVM
jgi:hypothetical protein